MYLLIVDCLRRRKWSYLVAGSMLAAFWLLHPGLVASLNFMVAIGVTSAVYIAPTEVLYLPLSRRELWKARWCVSIAVPVVLSVAAKLVVLGIAIAIAPKSWFSPTWLF